MVAIGKERRPQRLRIQFEKSYLQVVHLPIYFKVIRPGKEPGRKSILIEIGKWQKFVAKVI